MPPPPIVTARKPQPPPLAEGPSASSRTMIKLKPSSSSVSNTPEASKSKPKPRKPKVDDGRPPPYIDDGSHDLLQEVIAIEMEKDGKRRRSISEKDRVPEKRMRLSSDDDDDILAHAQPLTSKRKTSAMSSPVVADTTTNGVTSPVPHPIKQASATETPTSQPIPIRISLKGKEKETVPSPAPIYPKQKKSSTQTTPINEKKCKDVLKALLKLPDAALFSRPVDPELDGCPT